MSKKQARKNTTLAKIKKRMDGKCHICGGRGVDLCHVLPKSRFPEYYTDEWNLFLGCRYHHTMYDYNVEFRKRCTELRDRALENVKQEDVGRVNAYFGNL